MIVLTPGAGSQQNHFNPSEWKLRWDRRWRPEPPQWRWWEVIIAVLIVGLLVWGLLVVVQSG